MNLLTEWLEADGLGGFASGTCSGRRTRRYHALLLSSVPTGQRFVLVNGLDAWVETPEGTFAISTQHYAPDMMHPDGQKRLVAFSHRPWPCWTFRLTETLNLQQELFVPHESRSVVLRWQLMGAKPAKATLMMRPFLAGRDYHSLHHENGAFRFDATHDGERVAWQPYASLPAIAVQSNGTYRHDPVWYRKFKYQEEFDRGLDYEEDLASPGLFQWDLAQQNAIWIAEARLSNDSENAQKLTARKRFKKLQSSERERRAAFLLPQGQAADAYIIKSGQRKTIIAGYPWFTDWGRDTFIALRGLCLATGRLNDARQILLSWADTVSEGMLPNRFPDNEGAPEYNSVDASLWYIIAIREFLAIAKGNNQNISTADTQKLRHAVEIILTGYQQGTRYSIRVDDDGLIKAGEPGVQLTWMDAKLGDWVVTPRVGKPVEIQALWLNALWTAGRFSDKWTPLFHRGLQSFRDKFWNDARKCLFDVVDLDHEAGSVDDAVRPNQIFAVGGLPIPLLEGKIAANIVQRVEEELWTPLGLRSLSPHHPEYRGRYLGGVQERDGAYHQGTVWPWLLGSFVEAWVRVHGSSDEVKQTARERFLQPLAVHLDDAGLGHISEIADGDTPFSPRGCPFQAWSLGEYLRLDRVVLAPT